MYKRILLKLSGESLMGNKGYGIDEQRLADYAQQIQQIAQMGTEIGIVIGGGNIFRGLSGSQKGFDRVKGDQMGMLATVINSLALCSALESIGQKARVMTSVRMEPIGDLYTTDKALRLMSKGNVVIIAGGTGNPYFSTDTATVLRAVEIEAEVILLAKAIDGIYDSDPKLNPAAKKYDEISIGEVIDQRLGVMDLSASIMAMENKMPMLVFGLNEENSIVNTVSGKFTGTKVTV